MSLARRDDTLTDAQGNALAGAQVYYCMQPANTTTTPPTPLATIYDATGAIASNPQITDGYGHVAAYANSGTLYTVVYVHPLFQTPLVFPDQSFGAASGGTGYTPFSQVPSGTVDGTNRVFTLTITPAFAVIYRNVPLIQGLGYTLTGNTITYATAPQPGDSLYATGLS